MLKTFNAFEKATIKNTAKEVARLIARQERLGEQLKDYTEKIRLQVQEIEDTINQYEANIQTITGGYAASELCEKVNNLWVFKYPDTIVPPVLNNLKTEEKREEEIKEERKEEKVEQNEHLYEEEVTLRENPAELLDEDENKDVETFYEENNIVPDDTFVEDEFATFKEDEF